MRQSRTWRMWLLWSFFVFLASGAFGQTIQFLDLNNQPLTEASQFSQIWIQVTDSASAGLGSLPVVISSDLRGDHLSGPLPESPANSGIFRNWLYLDAKAPGDPSTGYGLVITEDPGPPHRFDTVRVTVTCQAPPCAEASIPTWASSLRFLDSQGSPLSRISAGDAIVLEGRDHGASSFAVTLTTQPGGDTETFSLRYVGGYPVDMIFRNTIPIPTVSGPAVPGDGVLQIQEGGTLTATHVNYLGLSATTISAPTGSILLELLDHRGNPTDTVFEHSAVHVRATDPGGNVSPAGVDTVTVTAAARSADGADRDTETFDLEETGPDTGVFVGEVPIWGAPGPVAENGTLENWHTGSGAADTVVVTYGPASVSGAVLTGRIWFADAAGNPVTQFSLGSRMYIFAEGDNYNVHPNPSTIDYIPYVTVRQASSGAYLYIELYETGPDTGLFSGYVNTGPGSTYPNLLYPQVGEEVEAKVVYGEPFPFSARATIGPNLPPVAVDDAMTVYEESLELIPVLLNDSDPENEALTLDSITVPPLHGMAWVSNGGSLLYSPEKDFNGSDTLRYRVRDFTGNTAEATVTFTVVGTNDPPVVGTGLIIDVVEDTPRTFTIPVSDAEGETTTLAWLVPPADGTLAVNPDGSFTYTPAPNANGDRTFTVRYQDTSGATADGTSTLRIAAVNDPPVAVDDAFVMPEDYWGIFAVFGNDSDVDGEPLVITQVTEPAHGTASGGGSDGILYIPAANYNGPDSFTYTLTDASGASSTATVRFTLTSVPDPPVAVADSATTAEDTPVSISVLANDRDGDGDTLTITYDGTQPSHGLVMFGDPGILIYRPRLNYSGPDSFTYVIADGTGSTATGTVTLTVTPVNDAPVAANDSLAIDEDTVGTLAVLANDSDVEGDTLTITAVTQGAHGTTVIRTGTPMTLGYTPVANYAGSDVLTYTISDGHGGTATATVNLVVRQIPDPPVAVDDAAVTGEDAAVTVNVLANDSDPDNNTLSVAGILTLPAHGTAVRNPNNTITYTPAANYNGSDSFTYNLADGTGRFAVGTVRVTITPVNDPPAAAGDSVSTAEDTPTTVSVLANDGDPDGDSLAITAVTQPVHGSAAFTPSGVTYTPAADYSGPDSFTYTISDGNGGSAIATVSVSVTAVNDSPTAVNDSASTAEDTATTVSVLANDSDPEGDSLAVTAVTQPIHGSATYTSSTVTYTPAADYSGPDSFAYTISDGNGGTATAAVSVTVSSVNDPPAAANDSASTAEDTATTVSVLANDSDPDGDSLAITAVTQPVHGSAAFTPSGVTYTPAADYNGPDSFTYTISDGNGGTATATVSVTVSTVNDPPVAGNDSASTAEDTATTVGVLANDSDPDGDSLTVIAVTQPAHGSAAFTPSGATYTPTANYNGPDSFAYTISDGNGGTATATVSVTVTAVNDSPAAGNDSASTAEDTATPISVLANDSDPEGDSLTVTAVTQPSHGSAAFTASGVTYTPAANYSGPDSFTYTISDGNGGSATATVSVTVSPVNDPPVAANDSVSTPEDTPTTVSVLANDSDPDSDSLTVTAVTQPAHGTAAFTPSGVIYTPAANYNGADSFTYTISDGNGGNATATVSVTVSPVNDPPVATNDSASTVEDMATTVGVLANDGDPDSDSLTVTAATQPAHGTAAFTPSGVTYTPAANYNGADSFTYTISDGNGGNATATVSVIVTPSNDLPVAGNDSASTAEDTPTTVSVLANDSDPDGDSLAVTAVTQPAHGSAAFTPSGVTYTPAADYNGPDSFAYTISDGNGGTATATVSVTVTAVNDSPAAGNDSASTAEDTATTISVLANDSDPEGDSLTILAAGQPLHGTVTFTASAVTYTPAPNYNGSDLFPYTASDGHGGSATAMVNLTVTPSNDPPVAGGDSTSTAEDTAKTLSVLLNDTDIDGDVLSITAVTQPAHGTASAAASTVTYTPAANYNGADAFTYTISDGHGGSATGAVSVSVTPVNDPPGAAGDSALTREGVGVSVAVLANDSDIEGNPLTVTGVSTPAKGSATFTASAVTYSPAANFNGTDSFTYTVSDGAATATGTVTVTVKDALERVAVLATNSVSVLTGADVLSGDVIANQAGSGPFLGGVELSLAGTVTTAAGWDVEGNRVTIATGATIGSDVFSNQLINSGTVTGEKTFTLALPVFSSLPAFLAATPNTTDVTVATNGSRTLAPGTYRDLVVGKKGTVLFTGGTYHFRSITGDTQTRLLFSAASTVRVQQKIGIKASSTVGPNTGASINASAIIFHVAGINGTGGGLAETPKAVEIGTDNILTANVYAPNGTLLIGDRTQAGGSFFGKDVQVGPDVQVTLQTAWSGQ